MCPPVRERRADLALLVNHYGDGHRRDVRSEHGEQLGDGDNEVGKIVALDTQSLREASHSRAGLPGDAVIVSNMLFDMS